MSTQAYIEHKVRQTDVWIGFYDRFKDSSSALNAAMAIGRLVGALEMLRNQERDQLAPEFQQLLTKYDEVWQRILLSE